MRSYHVGAYTGRTRGGLAVDERWLENDGLVNLISARHPFDTPAKDYDPEEIPPGVWNVLPAFFGDHMSLQGGLLRRTDIRPLYKNLLETIRQLP